MRTNLSLNAFKGDGTSYNKMDETTASGMDPSDVANKILQCMAVNGKEIVIAEPKVRIAIILRSLLPSKLFSILEKRAKKEEDSSG